MTVSITQGLIGSLGLSLALNLVLLRILRSAWRVDRFNRGR